MNTWLWIGTVVVAAVGMGWWLRRPADPLAVLADGLVAELAVEPATHVGVGDDAATGEWLDVIHRPVEGSDEWWSAELAALSGRLDEVVDNAWRRLDVKIRRLPHGLEIVSTVAADMQTRREFRARVNAGEPPTAEYPVIQVARSAYVSGGDAR